MKRIRCIFFLFVLILMIFVSFLIYRRNITKINSMQKLLEANNKNIDFKHYISNPNETEKIGEILTLAIEGDVDWSDLPLSMNFINKYKGNFDILPNRNKFDNISSSFSRNDKNTVIIYATLKEPFLKKDNNSSITYEYQYIYQLNDNNVLDSIELIDTVKTNSITGERIK